MNLKIIDALFNKMTVVYGNEWTKKWEGMPIEETKGAWASELRGFTVEQVKHALEKLPERPPNLIQFKALCQHAPVYFENAQLTYRPPVPQEKRAKLMEALGL
jgi:hypothetical protein